MDKLGEWRDAPSLAIDGDQKDGSADEKWREYSRGVVFFGLTRTLGQKLQSIFVPTMMIHWTAAVASVSQISTFLSTQSNADMEMEAEKKRKDVKKKRKLDMIVTPMLESDRAILRELRMQAEGALQSITNCCLFDTEKLVDEVNHS